MRAVITILVLVSCATNIASACRGPFSAQHSIHVEPESQIYLGRVLSIEDTVVYRGTQYERRVTKTRFKVIRAWQEDPTAEISVADVDSRVWDSKNCVLNLHPKAGEEWLVVAKRNGDSLYQDDLMGFKFNDEQYKKAILDTINALRPRSFEP